MTILRATSDIAVAISVSSLEEKRRPDTKLRACWRAVRTSTSALIGTTSSPASVMASRFPAVPHVEQVKTVLEVEGRHRPFQGQPKLHHRKRHVRLDPDDDAFRPEQLDHLGNAAQRADSER